MEMGYKLHLIGYHKVRLAITFDEYGKQQEILEWLKQNTPYNVHIFVGEKQIDYFFKQKTDAMHFKMVWS